MPPRNRAHPRQTGAAFTLVEIVLAVALLTLLVGAIAFNFNSLRTGQSLDEGATQFEALLRLARAHAAATGRPVHLGLVSPADSTNAPAGGGSESAAAGTNALILAVLTQPDPLRKPEIYQTLHATTYLVQQLADLIHLEVMLPQSEAEPAAAEDPNAFSAGSPDSSASGTNAAAGPSVAFAPFLSFQPDGSSGAADFVLHSRDPEDLRRVHIHLDAITGLLRRRWVAPDAVNPLEELPDEAADRMLDAEPGVTWDKNDPAFIPATNQFGP